MKAQEYNPNKLCSFCGTPKSKYKCSRCNICYYCSQECQKSHLKIHKPDCKTLTEKLNYQFGLSSIKSDRYYVFLRKFAGFELMFSKQLEINHYPPATAMNKNFNMTIVNYERLAGTIDVPRTDKDLDNMASTAKRLGLDLVLPTVAREEFGHDNIFYVIDAAAQK